MNDANGRENATPSIPHARRSVDRPPCTCRGMEPLPEGDADADSHVGPCKRLSVVECEHGAWCDDECCIAACPRAWEFWDGALAHN